MCKKKMKEQQISTLIFSHLPYKLPFVFILVSHSFTGQTDNHLGTWQRSMASKILFRTQEYFVVLATLALPMQIAS